MVLDFLFHGWEMILLELWGLAHVVIAVLNYQTIDSDLETSDCCEGTDLSFDHGQRLVISHGASEVGQGFVEGSDSAVYRVELQSYAENFVFGVSDLENAHADPETVNLDDVHFCYLLYDFVPCGRAMLVEVVVEIKPVAFYRASNVWIHLRLVDCAHPSSTSYDDFVVKDFDSFDVFLMKENGDGNPVLVLRSLARPGALDLYSALESRLSDLLEENVMVVVCALDCVRVVGRGLR